jgi:methyl-accepting chemotaxis protein
VEIGTEAGDLAKFFNAMVNTIRKERQKSRDQLNRFQSYLKENVKNINRESKEMNLMLSETNQQAVSLVESVKAAVQKIDSLVESLGGSSRQASQAAEDSSKQLNSICGHHRKLAFQTRAAIFERPVWKRPAPERRARDSRWWLKGQRACHPNQPIHQRH